KDASPEQLTTAVHPTTASTHVYQSSKDGNVTAMFGAGAEINGTWSPEIHYFSESDFPGNSGWYMFLALREKDIVNGIATSNYVRMVVLKSLSDGPEGPYGDPVTGAANQSRQMLDSEGNGYDEWACGQSVLRIPDGQYAGIYAMWVAETGRGQGAGKFYQKIMISRMALPWQLSGETGVVTTPTQDWEKKGSDDVLPMVVEGSTAIYGDHGEIFLAYCGSGYWSDYGLGQLTLARNGGDYANPLETSSWIKYEGNPVFSSTGTKDLRGAGHAFFLTDNEGMRFMCYHAYPYENGVRGSSRNAYLEPYSIDYDSVSETAPQGLLRLGLLETGKTAPVTSTFSFHLKK
ncbi:MAG: family 43 glycosylhydrolase, partial [Bacteroidales bacterium]|nr:family 43 glycosylhydrolase [Bacteroidales bacterium]